MPFLSLFDVMGIQTFIFGSNRLRENLGASYLVHATLNGWLKEELGAGTLLWTGGGNAVVRTEDLSDARAIAARLSARLLEDAPGLELACAHVPWDGQEKTYSFAAGEGNKALTMLKAARWPDATFDGGGVTLPCGATGAPSVDRDKKNEHRGRSISVKKRYEAYAEAESRLKRLLELPKGLVWSDEVDALGRTRGEESALAVIHFDGNGMGNRFREAGRKGVKAITSLSDKVNRAGIATLQAGLEWVNAAIRGDAFGDPTEGGFSLAPVEYGAGSIFPVRPILYGGDDITLLCDGRIGLDLAARLLTAWHAQTKVLVGEALHACAGVAIVGPHSPFSRAVRLSEDLCRAAKKELERQGLTQTVSALDWELSRDGSIESLSSLRDSRRVGEAGPRLMARPYIVVGDPKESLIPAYRRWDWFRWTLLLELRLRSGLREKHPTRPLSEGGDPNETMHSQLKGLASVLFEGEEATKRLLERWRVRDKLELPATGSRLGQTAFDNDETPYLDALELMDLLAVAEVAP